MHGLGATSDDLATLAPMFELNHLPLQFIFPQAPTRPVTINGGYHMPAWYDIHSLDRSSPDDEEGICRAEQQIAELIQQQNDQGIPSHQIFLLGFSQGGALALFTGLRYHEPLGGIIGLSTYLPVRTMLTASLHAANRSTPVMLAHGENDMLVEPTLAMHAKQTLLEHNYTTDWFTYPMDHSICQEEIADISMWLQTIMKKIDPQ